MDSNEKFRTERQERISDYANDQSFWSLSQQWLEASIRRKYVYNFEWLGRPIIQYPQDIVAIQELVWNSRPDLIIETGIAHGGSLILSASLLALLDLCESSGADEMSRHVIGVDIDIRRHNRIAIEAHPLANRISLIEGSSISSSAVQQIKTRAAGYRRVMVFLDSMHTHDHVLAELEAYAPLVSLGSFCVVFDTLIEDMPAGLFPDRPWDVGNNPKTAVRAFLKNHPEFQVDGALERKLQITSVQNGFLKRIA